jgi:hypothetical protein
MVAFGSSVPRRGGAMSAPPDPMQAIADMVRVSISDSSDRETMILWFSPESWRLQM